MMKESSSAEVEFDKGRILWTEDGWPLDARKPASMDECVVLGCSNKCAPGSGFCAERHRYRPGVASRGSHRNGRKS